MQALFHFQIGAREGLPARKISIFKCHVQPALEEPNHDARCPDKQISKATSLLNTLQYQARAPYVFFGAQKPPFFVQQRVDKSTRYIAEMGKKLGRAQPPLPLWPTPPYGNPLLVPRCTPLSTISECPPSWRGGRRGYAQVTGVSPFKCHVQPAQAGRAKSRCTLPRQTNL